LAAASQQFALIVPVRAKRRGQLATGRGMLLAPPW
jgi:hypothetical protein